MNIQNLIKGIRYVSFAFTALLMAASASAADEPGVAGYPAQEALRLGEAIYDKGVLPSGKPVTAVVRGDIKLKGTMVTCSNCHRRGGLGSLEGGVLTPPTNGAKLYLPLQTADLPGPIMNRDLFKHPRPAYTDESLTAALRVGIDPAGRTLDQTMPRYLLDDDDAKILVYYLKHLSTGEEPGLKKDDAGFATVVAEGVDPVERDAMLVPLAAYVQEEWNSRLQSTAVSRRSGLKKMDLDIWELKGAPETWGGQLEGYYRQRPVFAILGGIAPGSWRPIHEFCEKNRVPCVFPVTDLPVISKTDWYTLYFSKGLYQEGEAAAKYLGRVFELPPDKQIVQVRRDDDRGKALSDGFSETWKKLGASPMTEVVLPAGKTTDAGFWKELSAAHPNSVMLLWLGPDDLAGIEALDGLKDRPSTVLVSATMLGGKATSLPDGIRDFTLITWPELLPTDMEFVTNLITNWLKAKKVPAIDVPVSAKVYFMTRMVLKVLLDMREDFYRLYFLDLMDELPDQSGIAATYTRLSFGPGQRYASKGCYIARLTKGEKPKVVKQSDWIIY